MPEKIAPHEDENLDTLSDQFDFDRSPKRDTSEGHWSADEGANGTRYISRVTENGVETYALGKDEELIDRLDPSNNMLSSWVHNQRSGAMTSIDDYRAARTQLEAIPRPGKGEAANASSRQQHYSVASRVPDIIQIADGPTESHLGAFKIRDVPNRAVVPLGMRNVLPLKQTDEVSNGIEVDFQEIEALNSTHLAEEFTDFMAELESDPEWSELHEALEKLDEEDRFVATTGLFASRLAAEFFDPAAELSRGGSEQAAIVQKRKLNRDNSGWKFIDPARADSYGLKRLSDTSDNGVCAEYTLFAKEVMNRLGAEADYTVAYRRDWKDMPWQYHAMLTTESGMVIDPIVLAQDRARRRPFGIYKAPEGQTLEDDPTMVAGYKDIFGRDSAPEFAAVAEPAERPVVPVVDLEA